MTAPIREAVRFRFRARAFGRLLAHRGFRASDIAQAVGVSRATVSRWEHGTLSVRGDHALTVAALLNAKFEELFVRAPAAKPRQAAQEARQEVRQAG